MTIAEDRSSWVVLIVDDDRDNIGVPEQLLLHFGATVHIAEDGQVGLRILETVIPSFILLDLSMPRLDGWEMLVRLRSNPRTASIPVIALTAHAMPADEARIIQAGFDGYIVKPFMFASFFDEIMRCLEKADQREMSLRSERHGI
jgi:CheY-like chemotaxis protein